MQRFHAFAVDVGERLDTLEQGLTRVMYVESQLPKFQHFEQQLGKLARKMLQLELNADMASWGPPAAAVPAHQEAAAKNQRNAAAAAARNDDAHPPEVDEATYAHQRVTLLAMSVC
jgi:hypothetical protein